MPMTIIDLGAAPNVLLKVTTVSHVVEVPPVPVVIVNDPALSVEAAVTAADGVAPQLAGVPMVGGFVCVTPKWLSVSVKVAKVVGVPRTVSFLFVVSATNRGAAAESWIWKAVVELVELANVVAPVLLTVTTLVLLFCSFKSALDPV